MGHLKPYFVCFRMIDPVMDPKSPLHLFLPTCCDGGRKTLRGGGRTGGGKGYSVSEFHPWAFSSTSPPSRPTR